MINNDLIASNNHINIFTLPTYKCPLCRHETTIKWYDRPKNQTLIDILNLNENYKKANDEYNLKVNENNQILEQNQMDIPERINLSYISNNIRIKRAEQLYNYYLPILLQYALEGKTHINITEPSKVAEIGSVADILSHKLMTHNGIFRFFCNSRECQIEIVPRESLRFDYENNHFNADNPYTDPDNIEGSTSPPNTQTINPNINDVYSEFSNILTDELLLNLVNTWRNIERGRTSTITYARNLNENN
jgi:hypothetical protein